MKTVLLHVYGDDGQKARLDAAIALVRAFDGKLQCIQVNSVSPYVVTDPFGGTYMVAQIYETLRREASEDKAAIDSQLKDAGISGKWIMADGGFAQSIVSWSRLLDIIVLGKPDHDKRDGSHPLSIVDDVALSARSPVLVIPESYSATFDPKVHAMVAWNGSPEGAHALRAALPMLKIASAVTLVTVGNVHADFPAGDVIDYLALHDIAATVRALPTSDAFVADVLIETARSLPAAYLVMGAYGHSRFREAVLGGVTRAMLDHCDVPLVLAH